MKIVKKLIITLSKEDRATIEINQTAFTGKQVRVDGSATITIETQEDEQ